MSKLEEIEVLKKTIEWFKKQIEPHDCGWMYTTIDGLKYRIKHLRKEKQMNKDLIKKCLKIATKLIYISNYERKNK